jgi:hypothetical protein
LLADASRAAEGVLVETGNASRRCRTRSSAYICMGRRGIGAKLIVVGNVLASGDRRAAAPHAREEVRAHGVRVGALASTAARRVFVFQWTVEVDAFLSTGRLSREALGQRRASTRAGSSSASSRRVTTRAGDAPACRISGVTARCPGRRSSTRRSVPSPR